MKPAAVLSGLALLGALLLTCSPAQAQPGQINGTVIDDASGNPIPGVNVVIEGSQQGAATGAEGTYIITGVEPGTYTLMATFVGYGEETQEGVEVAAGETTTVDIVMQQEAVGLDEVVAIGYGEQQQRDLTGAVSTVSAEELEQVSISSVDQALQGLSAGAYVKNTSSAPGGGVSIRIRGQGSVTSGNEPLYVIDGMPIENSTDNLPGTGSQVQGPNPLSTLNPQNIESIQVLKDASATAIYGSRGSNGVVIIETRGGRSGRTQVNFTSSLSMSQPSRTYDLLNAQEYITYANEGGVNRGIGERWSDPASSYSYTDWQDLIYESGMKQNYQLSVSGGDADTRFSVSGNFLDDKGVVENSTFRRYSGRINFGQDVSDDFRVLANMNASRGEYALLSQPGAGDASPVQLATAAIPVIDPFSEDGSYTDFSRVIPFSTSNFSVENPIAFIRERNDDTKINRFIGNAQVQYDLLDNLELQVKVGADIEEYKRGLYRSERLIEVTVNGIGEVWNRRRINVLNENLLVYSTTLSDAHDLDVTAGYTWQNETTEDNSLQNSDFVSGATGLDALETGAQIGGPNINTGRFEWTLISWLGRVNYAYDGRYLLTLTGRADGSSKFGRGNKWGFFPSGALGWRVIDEPFMRDQDVVSNLKLRVSYGLSGNQSIGTYSSLAQLSTANYLFGGPNASEIVGLVPSQVANPDLRWETSQQWDLGLDLGLWDQQLRFTADLYRKETTDLILPVTLPASSGFGASIQNTGTVLNEGVELSVDASVFAGSFSWITGANFSANRNEVTDLGRSDEFFGPSAVAGDAVGSIVREGEPVGMFWGMETNGIINTEAEREELGYGELGGIRFVDQNGDGQITEGDRTIIGNPHPDFVYGWNNTFSYEGFRLAAFVQGVYGNDIWKENENATDMIFDSRRNTFQERFDERWTPENAEGATWPKAGYISQGAANGREQEFIIEDGSYLRLKTLTLSYDIPVDYLGWVQRQGLQQARIYVQGSNLFTITGYSGLNPDTDSRGQGSINIGYDDDTYPMVQALTVGVDLTF